MLTSEALDRVSTIIAPQEAELQANAAEADSVRQQLADAKVAVGVAEGVVKTAKQGLKDAESQVRTFESSEQGAERAVEAAAKNVAVTIIRDPELEPVTKTLFSLTYTNRTLAWQEGSSVFADEIEKGKIALSAIMGRLASDAPILFFKDSGVTADTATDESLVATSPNAINKYNDSYVSIEGGSIAVVMPDTTTAKSSEGLVVVEQKTVEAVLLSGGGDRDRLEAAASNKKWLVIGEAAVVARLEGLEPMQQFVALTALKGAGIEMSLQVDPELKTKTEQSLVALLAFLASGTGQETRTRGVVRRDAWTGGSHRSQVTTDTPLTRMAKSVDKQSMRLMAQTLGISKEELRAKTETALKSRVANDTTSLNQLGKDVQSLAMLDQILETVF